MHRSDAAKLGKLRGKGGVKSYRAPTEVQKRVGTWGVYYLILMRYRLTTESEVFPVNAALTGPGTTSEPGLNGLDSFSGIHFSAYTAPLWSLHASLTRGKTRKT